MYDCDHNMRQNKHFYRILKAGGITCSCKYASPPISLMAHVCLCVCVYMCVFLCLCVCAAPSVLRERGRHTECQQPDHCVDRRQDVLLEPGHAVPATGTQHTDIILVLIHMCCFYKC